MNDQGNWQISPSVPPSKKNNPINYIVAVAISLVVICICIIVAISTSSSSNPASTTPIPLQFPTSELLQFAPAPVNTSSAIQYQISGSAFTASVTYENSTGGTEQQDISLPWTYPTFRASSGTFVYISAQISDNDPGSITCKILLNGSVYKTSTSSGQFVIATCSGEVP